MKRSNPLRIMRWRRSGLLLGLLLLAVPLSVRAQDESQERFELFTRCAAMDLRVSFQDNADGASNLTIGQIERAVRSRLRAARLYRETSSFMLRVFVMAQSQAFSVDLSFYKSLYDSTSSVQGLAITWQSGGVGTHGGNANYVLSSISQEMDEFLDDYLRVNESACAPAVHLIGRLRR